MLLLKRSKSDALELSDKKQTVELTDSAIKLGSENISSPGEYEQGGVEIVYASNAALLVWDHMQIAYVFNSQKPDAFEKNKFSSADVMILSEAVTECSKDDLVSLTDVYDPRVVVFGAKTVLEKSYKDSLKPVEDSTVKLAAQTMPTEGRDHYVLT